LGRAGHASSITLIQDGQLYYRGQDATKLAAWASLEQIAELLWEQTVVSFEAPQIPAGIPRLEDDPIASFQAALPLCGSQDLSSFDLRPEAFAKTGARIVRLLATIAAGRTSTEPVHRHLLSAWAPECEDAGEAIRAAMVLCADHELNVSAFVARCAASAACAPYDVVSAALATLKGQRHGGQSEASTRLIAEAASAPSISRLLHNRLRSGEGIPGFGHQLYPAGDPRAKFLLSLAERSGREEEWSVVSELRTTAAAILDEAPNLDFGLAALAHVYRLPEHAPLVLFAIGRTVGWIAHAIEQTQTPHLIRPRAHYTGPPPDG
jgi:citrate synthase